MLRRNPPNILVFCVDMMRADHMACAGNPIIRTPNLDDLAARGTLFTRSYCNNPICMPARASMFTGLMPRDHGVRINGQSLRRDIPTLPQVLANHGYRTHSAGKLHLTPYVPGHSDPEAFPESLADWNEGRIHDFPLPYYGFQSVDFVGGHTSFVFGAYIDWLRAQGGDPSLLRPDGAREVLNGAIGCYRMGLPTELHYNRYIADSMISLVRDSATPSPGSDDRPFMAWCSFPDPHPPLAPPAPFDTMYDPADVPLPTTRDGEVHGLPPIYSKVLRGEVMPGGEDQRLYTIDHWRHALALTYGMITHVDSEVGRVLAALDASGLADNTVVVFLSDHGHASGDHGLTTQAFYTFSGSINIPTIVAAPEIAGHGRGGRRCDALISQIDLMPSILDLCGLPLPDSNRAGSPSPFPRGTERPLTAYPGRSWRPLLDGSAASIHEAVVIENDDVETGYRVRCLVTLEHRMAIYPATSDGELFDLRNDPDELHNLWHDPGSRELRTRLIEQLLSEYILSAPLGPVPHWNS